MRTAVALVAVLAVGAGGAAAPAAQLPTATLKQLAGKSGCVYDPRGGQERGVREDLPSSCTAANALDGAFATALTPDGRHLYVASFSGDTVSLFARARSGRVTQRPGGDACLIEGAGPLDVCRNAFGIDGPAALAVSPDGRHLYVGGFFSRSVAGFERDRTSGVLRQLTGAGGCVASSSDEPCDAGRALFAVSGVAVSPDGRNVYATGAGSDAIAAFTRNPTTGALTQLAGAEGCHRQPFVDPELEPAPDPAGCTPARALANPGAIAISRNGRFVYVASLGSNAVAVFARSPTTGALRQLRGAAGCISELPTDGCADGRGLQGPLWVTLSPDGRNLYVATGFDVRLQFGAFETSGIASFTRNATSGVLRQLPGKAGCVTASGSRGACERGRALEGASMAAVTPDGRNLYVAATASDAIAIFVRNSTSGRLRQLGGRSGCISDTGTRGACRVGVGLLGLASIAVSPDSRFAYASGYYASALTIFERPAARSR